MTRQICPDCLIEGKPTLTSRPDGRCVKHARLRRRIRNVVYDDPRWRQLVASVVGAWRGMHGDVCPGAPELGHASHPTTDLTLDHIIPVSALASNDPRLFARSNTRVLCGSWNSRKGGRHSAGNNRVIGAHA